MQVRLLSSVLMLGLLLGSIIGGRLGDKIGRKTTMFAAIAIAAPAVAAGGLVQSYMVYLLLRLVSCTCLPVIWVCFHVRMTAITNNEIDYGVFLFYYKVNEILLEPFFQNY